MVNKVVNYDGFDYDYTSYWGNREYENLTERIVLNKLLKNEIGQWFIDIGGSYGRLAGTYADRFKHCVIIDYSLKTLKRNYDEITKVFPNIIMVAANAYKMPFADNSFDAGLTVRVLHHITRHQEFFTEIHRILQNDSTYIQDFANKIHLKARTKAFLRHDRSINSREPLQQPTITMEGSRDGNVSFLNFHPQYIQDVMEYYDYKIIGKQGCSYLRIPFLKKIFGPKILLFFEKFLQLLLAKTNISPSIFLKTKVVEKTPTTNNPEKLEDMLVCPICKDPLEIGESKATCKSCDVEYLKEGEIWDFRVD